MKKSIIALSIALASTSAVAANVGHIGDQSGRENTIGSIQVGDIENVMGNVCNQSGNQNSCAVSVDNVNGDLNIADGANVTINQTSEGGKTKVNQHNYDWGTRVQQWEERPDGSQAVMTVDYRNDGTVTAATWYTDTEGNRVGYEANQVLKAATDEELAIAKEAINNQILVNKIMSDNADTQLSSSIDNLKSFVDNTVMGRLNEQRDIIFGEGFPSKEIFDKVSDLKADGGIAGNLIDLEAKDVDLQEQIDAWVDTDTVRSDAEIKAIADVGDKILGNEIDELRDQTTAQHNAQNNAIATQWDMIKDVEKVNADQQAQIDNKVNRDEFEADQARQDAALGELANGIGNVSETVNNLGDAVTNIQGDLTDLGDRVSNNEQAIVNQGDRITNVEGAVVDLGDRVTSVEAELGNKVDRDEYLVDQARQDAETARVESESLERDQQLAGAINVVDNKVDKVAAQVSVNASEISRVENDSAERDQAIVDYVIADQDRQDAVITANDKASKERDAELAKAVTTVDAKTEANKAEIAKVDSASKDRDAAIVANQAKVDAKQDKVFHDYRATQAQVDAGQYASIDELYGATSDLYATQEVHSVQIAGLNSRVSDLENSVNGLKKDVKRLDGMVAANIAASSMETPIDWDGSLAVQVGVGHYNGSNALALGVMGGNDKVVIKATVAATDADNWGKVAVGASATFSTGLLK